MFQALLLQKIFSILTDYFLIIFLKYSQELRNFCGFLKVPDASKFTYFKQEFILDLQLMFDDLADITEPICQQINENIAFMTENNPKYANCIIKQLKTYKKIKGLVDSYDLYKATYGTMPSHADS